VTRLGPEYRGKLPPGAEDQLKRELEDLREVQQLGLLKGVKILSGPGCAVSEAQEGKIYPLDKVPSLPLPGCDRLPCCACCYVAALKE
jgi:hypothetical protein